LRGCQEISYQVLFYKISVLLQHFNKLLALLLCVYDMSSGKDLSDSDLQPVRSSFKATLFLS
jgi:hypothetical protein